MTIHDLRPALLAIVALAYFGLAGQVVARRQIAGSAGRWLVVYTCLGGAWAVLDWLRVAGSLARWPGGLLAHLPLYAALSLGIAFLQVTREFLRVKRTPTRWNAFGAAWLAGLLLIDGVLPLDRVLLAWPGWSVGRDAFTQAALAFGWALYAAAAVLLTLRIYRHTTQPLHRNRLAYWSVAISIMVAATGMLVAGQDSAGEILLVSAALVATLAIVTHRLPDMRQALRQATALLATTSLAAIVYAGAILLLPAAERLIPGLSVPLVAIVLGLAVVAAANPVLAVFQRGLRRWALGGGYDPRRIIGEYGLAISGIVELERLASVALSMVKDGIGVEQGALFLVDPPAANASQAQFYCLRAVGALGLPPRSGALLADSPLAAYLTQEFAPLTQYELDLNPRFHSLSAAERLWLQGLGMDVYVPIYASQQWIGMLALGPKVSRHRYFDDELQLLSTLAEQTAVALKNARLVDDLVRLNAEIKAANSALDQANAHLAHLDRVKSEFITVISHELRTPLSILFGYAQILLNEVDRDGDSYHHQIIEGINTGTTRMQEIIENMLDVTKIDSRALVLSSTPVSIGAIVQKVLDRLQRPLLERQLAVEIIDLAALPPIEADAAALGKVFYHLLVNAVKFTPDGGRIVVTGRCLEDALPGAAVEVSISDTGIGIDPRFLDLIFTKFYRTGDAALHSTGKTKFKGGGPGLGLAIARGIVEAHGGHLRAESTGHDEKNLPGSRFVVLLPLGRQSDHPQ